jgi:hypothetical protein
LDLGVKLAEHANATRKEDQVDKPPPGKAFVTDWKKAADKIRQMAANVNSAAASRQRVPKQPRMEEALHPWFKPQEQRDLVITDELLYAQAKTFGLTCDVPEDFAYWGGWLEGFKKRWGIRSYQLHGEAGDAHMEGFALAQANPPILLEDCSLYADSTYNQDKTGLLWRQPRTRTNASANKPGKKAEKQRVTVTLVGIQVEDLCVHTQACVGMLCGSFCACADGAGSLMSVRVYVSRKVRSGEPISVVKLGCRSRLHGSTNCACACAMRSKLGRREHI